VPYVLWLLYIHINIKCEYIACCCCKHKVFKYRTETLFLKNIQRHKHNKHHNKAKCQVRFKFASKPSLFFSLSLSLYLLYSKHSLLHLGMSLRRAPSIDLIRCFSGSAQLLAVIYTNIVSNQLLHRNRAILSQFIQHWEFTSLLRCFCG
jgi:hypothetical protein